MADGVAITAGAGTTVATDDAGAAGHVQVMKLAISTDGSATLIPAEATNGLDVDVTRIIPGTAATELGKAEDVAHASGDVGVMALAVRTDTATARATTDGDYIPLIVDSTGKLHVNVGVIAAGTNNIGDVDVLTLPNVTLAAGTNTNEAVGDVAEDAALAGNPLRQGVRAHSGVPTAMSASNDVVTPWADLSGAQAVIPQPRMVDIQGVSALGTSVNYDSGDYMGAVITFTSVALASGRPLQIVGATILDRAIQSVPLTLLLFRASPTVASADNAALSITAANASTARFLGAIRWAAADYVGATSCSFCNGTLQGGPATIPIVTSGSANIFGVLVAGGIYNAAAAGDLEINLACTQF